MLDLHPEPTDLDADRDRLARRDRRAAARAAAVDAAARLRQRSALPEEVRRGAASIPDDLKSPGRSGEVSVHHQGRTCATTIRSACSRCRASRSCASTPRRAPPASRPWSATPSGDIDTWADVVARSIRAVRRPAGHDACTSPTATACSPAGSARTTAPSGSAAPSIPVSGGMTERQVQLICDFEPDIIMVTPSYMLAILDEFRSQGIDPRKTLAQGRHLRRRALDQRHARRRSRRPSTCTPSTSTACPR